MRAILTTGIIVRIARVALVRSFSKISLEVLMKSFLFMLLGLVAGCGAIILCYAFVSIPIVPCAAVWLAGFLCSKAIRGISRAVVVIAKIIVAILFAVLSWIGMF